YVAQKEREFNRQRQAEGIAAAKAKGVKFGRPPKLRTAAFYGILNEWKCGNVSARQAAMQLEIDRKTFMRWVSEC
ncbi:MAG: recombinase family protein, partial [Bacillota bacterium]